MHVLFTAPQHVGLWGQAGGVLKLMQLYRRALDGYGHTVSTLGSDGDLPSCSADLCHLFVASGDTFNLGASMSQRLPLVLSPILDKPQGNWLLRFNRLVERLLPGVFTHVGRAAALCSLASRLCFMSEYEERRVRGGLGATVPGDVIRAPLPALPPASASSGRERPYLLFVGDAGNPRKNVLRLIAAARVLEMPLKIAGPMSAGPTARAVERKARRESSVELLGLLDEPSKRALMETASALVLPSLTEGIGFAALEAGSLGTPVVITREGGARDYFGDAASYVDPGSVADIRRGIEDAIAASRDPSGELARRCSDDSCGAALTHCYASAVDAWSRGRRR